MKKLIILFITLALTAASAFAQILNPGFESWTNQGSYSTPDNWGNLNAMTSFASVYTCSKGTPGNPGTSYVKLISKNVSGMGVMPGLAASGTLDVANMKASGFAYTSRPQNFTGSWQFMESGADQGYVSVVLSAWNSSMSMRDTVAYAVQSLSGMLMSWTNFSLPLIYKTGGNPDTVTIILSSSGQTPVAGSYLYADDLNFSGTVTGIKEQSHIGRLSLYPNPTSDKVSISLFLEKNTSLKMQMLDLSGKIVREMGEQEAQGQIIHSLNLESLASGIYFLKITTDNGSEVRKITIE